MEQKEGKARFSAATSRWALPEFKRLLLDLAATFNLKDGNPQWTSSRNPEDLDRLLFEPAQKKITAASNAMHLLAGVIFAKNKVELRFEDQGDDGRHVPRCACVFETAKDLLDFFFILDKDKRAECIAVANGFVAAYRSTPPGSKAPPMPDDDDDDDDVVFQNNAAKGSPPPPAHEVAVALDLFGQGVLCDLRLRLRALERSQRHLGALRFIADADSPEDMLLPVWRDLVQCDGFVKNDLNTSLPPHYSARTQPLLYRPQSSHDWAAPPKWQTV